MTSNPRGEMVAVTVDGYVCPAGVVDRTIFVNFTAPLQVYSAGENSLEVITQDKVQSICAENNGILSGLETMDELSAAMEQLEKLSETFNADVNLWIDGVYNPECFKVTTPNCSGVNAFNFTDPYLQSFAGYDWWIGEPRPVFPDEEYCLKLMDPLKKNNRFGKVAVFSCITPNSKALPNAVLCGNLASRLTQVDN